MNALHPPHGLSVYVVLIPSLVEVGRVGIGCTRPTHLCISLCLWFLRGCENQSHHTTCGFFSCGTLAVFFLYRHAQRCVFAMSVFDSLAFNDHHLNRLTRVLLDSLRPQDAIVERTFDKEAGRVQAHGAGQLQARKPRVHCSGGGCVEHVSGGGLTSAVTACSCLSLFFDLMLHCNCIDNHTAGADYVCQKFL